MKTYAKHLLPLFLWLVSAGLFAQAPPLALPAGSESRHREELRENFQLQRQIQDSRTRPPTSALSSPQEPIPMDAQSMVKQFKLQRVELEPFPATLSEAEVETIVGRYTAMDGVSLHDIYTMLSEIDALFDSKHIIGRAVLTPQEVQDGVLKIRIIEARLDRITVKTKRLPYPWEKTKQPVSVYRPFRRGFVSRNFTYPKNGILNTRRLENRLERYNRLYDSKLTAEIESGRHFGTSNIALTVYEPQPVTAAFFADNTGRTSTGEYRAGGMFQLQSVLGLDESFLFSYDETEGADGLYMFADIPVTSFGTTFEIAFDRTDTHVIEGDAADLNIRGSAKRLRPGFRQVFHHDKHGRWGGFILTEIYDSGTTLDGVSMFGEDITSIIVGIDGRSVWKDRSRFWSIGLTTGNGDLESFAGTERTRFSYLRGSLTQAWYPNKKWTFIVGLYGQWAFSDLPASQQYQLGGMATVRGVREALLYGSHGYNINLEARRLLIAKKKLRVEGFGFFDHGGIFYRDHVDSPSDFLFSLGGGLMGTLGRFTSFTGGVGLPIFKKEAHAFRKEIADARGYFTLMVRF